MAQAAPHMQLASRSITHHFCIWCIAELVNLLPLLPLLNSLHKSVSCGTIQVANMLYISAAEIINVAGAREALHCRVRAQKSSLLSSCPAPGQPLPRLPTSSVRWGQRTGSHSL